MARLIGYIGWESGPEAGAKAAEEQPSGGFVFSGYGWDQEQPAAA